MKIYKKLLALLLIAVCCVPLCGCLQLDELEKNCAFWTDSGHTAITYSGQTYVQTDIALPDTAARLHSRYLSVAESDVPLLLVDSYGEGGLLFRDDTAIAVWSDDSAGYYRIYCLEDSLADLETAYRSYSGYTHFYLSCADSESWYASAALDDVLTRALQDPAASGETVPGDELYDAICENSDYHALFAADDSGLYGQWMDLYRADGHYYLSYIDQTDPTGPDIILLIDDSSVPVLDAALAEAENN